MLLNVKIQLSKHKSGRNWKSGQTQIMVGFLRESTDFL